MASFTGPGGQRPEDAVIRLIEDLQPTEEDLASVGQYLRQKIRKRTLADQSVDGGSFTGYSESYQKQKRQSQVDLYSRKSQRHMLDALDVQVSNNLIEVGIFNDEEIASRAKLHNEGGSVRTRQKKGAKRSWFRRSAARSSFTMPARRWLGATAEDISEMTSLLITRIKDRWLKAA